LVAKTAKVAGSNKGDKDLPPLAHL
jgi:hypothetical protein